MTAYDENAPVLIVGGGYAGLASALFLSHHGVRPVLVDRHPTLSLQGRARGINQRTMELYRPLGIESRIREVGRPFDEESGVVRCTSLADEWDWLLEEARGTPPELTASEFGMADQRSVEPVLIDAARRAGADIRFNTQCVSVEADAGGVTAVTRDRDCKRPHTLRSDYLIAADGFRGTIARGAGIDRTGPGVTQHWVTFVIEADLSDIVTRRALFWIVVNPELGRLGSFLTTAVPNQWAVSVTYDPAHDAASDFTPARCRELARAVIGRDVPVKILDIAAWEEAVGVADRFRSGRILLAGDSAHVWPPAGAMGANAAVQDAHNLAWKLAGVINGWAADGLLDSYEAERRPVAQTLADITVRRQQARFGDTPDDDDVDDILCILGQRYRSAAIIGAGHTTVYGDRLEQRAVPGVRAPHLWLGRNGGQVPVHDLFHAAFVLFTGAAGVAWTTAARAVADRTGVPLRAYRVGPASAGADLLAAGDDWEQRYGPGDDGAVLVRPDGYVAWRSAAPPADPAALLADVFGRLLGRAG